MALLYADEDFPHPVADRVRSLGHDVLTALADGKADRAVVTLNRRHYIRLHRNSGQHAGIIVWYP